MTKIVVAKDKSEAARVPTDQPLAIDLSRTIDVAPQTEIKYGEKPKQEAKQPEQPEVRHRLDAPPPETPAEPSLEKQLAQLRESEERSKQRAVQAEADRNSIIQQAQQREQEMNRRTEGAQHESLVSAISAVQSESKSALAAYTAALQAQDYTTAGQAQQRMMRAEARLVQLESGKDELERRLQQPPQPQQYQTTSVQQPHVEQMLSTMPGLLEKEREYIRKHPESLTNPANQRRLEVAFLDAQQRGLERGSDDYFKLFDERLGYQQRPTPREEEMSTENNEPPMPAAPVSRNVPGQHESDTRVVLTPQQREAAKWAGIDEFEYAKGLVKLRNAKKDGLLQQG